MARVPRCLFQLRSRTEASRPETKTTANNEAGSDSVLKHCSLPLPANRSPLPHPLKEGTQCSQNTSIGFDRESFARLRATVGRNIVERTNGSLANNDRARQESMATDDHPKTRTAHTDSDDIVVAGRITPETMTMKIVISRTMSNRLSPTSRIVLATKCFPVMFRPFAAIICTDKVEPISG